MQDFLRDLPPGSYVLDLGSAGGSFTNADRPDIVVVRLDLEVQTGVDANFIVGNAAALPLRSNCLDLVIANHSLEHFSDLAGSLQEIGRVLKPTGGLLVSVPDSSTITDRIYRWLARGGGHVNPFVSSKMLAGMLTSATQLKLNGIRTLCTSLSFLNSRNRRARAPMRLYLLGGGSEFSLLLLTFGFRIADRFFKTRLSVYGWAFYLGRVLPNAPISEVWTNVCVRCGAGHSSPALLQDGRFLGLRRYQCPSCNAMNLFTDDADFAHLAVGSDS